MPSIFPILLSYEMAIPLLFRILAGLLFVYFGYGNITKNRAGKIAAAESFKLKPGAVWLWIASVLEIVGGILLLAGFLTQIASLVLSVLIIIGLAAKNKKSEVIPLSAGFLFLLLIVTASLLLLGPGLYSIDLPF